MRGSLLRVGGLGILALVVGIALFLASVPSGMGDRNRSILSTEDGGRLASFLLLDRLGFDPSPWRRAPGHLPRNDDLLWLPAVPEAPPVYDKDWFEDLESSESGRDGVDGPRRPRVSRRLRDPRHYRRFLEEGGTLVCGWSDDIEEFLTFDLDLVELEALTRAESSGGDPQVLLTRTGERIEAGWRGARWLEVAPGEDVDGGGFDVRLKDEEGRAILVTRRIGRGRIAVLPDDGFLANARIDAGENALLLVRVVEDLRGTGELLFDEYALGGWVPETPLELAFAPHGFSFSVHVLVLLGLLLWTLAWGFPFPRDPTPLATMAPVARAEAHGRMLESAGRWDVIADILRVGVLRRLSPGRRRLQRVAAGEPDGDAEALRAGKPPSEEELKRILEPLAPEASTAQLEEWRRALAGRGVGGGGRTGLEALHRTLAEVEGLARARGKDQNARASRRARTGDFER